MKTRRWDFISAHRAKFGVQRLCRVLGTSRSGYYKHPATEPARVERQAEEATTVAEIRAIHAEHRSAYGGPARAGRTPVPRTQDQPQAGDPADADPPRRRPAPAPHQAHDHRGPACTEVGEGDGGGVTRFVGDTSAEGATSKGPWGGGTGLCVV